MSAQDPYIHNRAYSLMVLRHISLHQQDMVQDCKEFRESCRPIELIKILWFSLADVFRRYKGRWLRYTRGC
jgi:hypothetical protein